MLIYEGGQVKSLAEFAQNVTVNRINSPSAGRLAGGDATTGASRYASRPCQREERTQPCGSRTTRAYASRAVGADAKAQLIGATAAREPRGTPDSDTVRTKKSHAALRPRRMTAMPSDHFI